MRPDRSSATAGFTLVEVLVAFLVLAVFMGAVTRELVAGRAGAVGSLDVTAAEAVARTLMVGPMPSQLRGPGRLTGRLDGRDYVMTTEALELPPAGPRTDGRETPPAAWRPLRLTVSVAAGPTRSVTVETVRLVLVESAP